MFSGLIFIFKFGENAGRIWAALNEKGPLTKEEISKLTKTIMQSPNNGMPIAIWLIHEQNKDKTMMTFKK